MSCWYGPWRTPRSNALPTPHQGHILWCAAPARCRAALASMTSCCDVQAVLRHLWSRSARLTSYPFRPPLSRLQRNQDTFEADVAAFENVFKSFPNVFKCFSNVFKYLSNVLKQIFQCVLIFFDLFQIVDDFYIIPIVFWTKTSATKLVNA